MIELKDDDNKIKMEEYLEDAIADACYALGEIIELMSYMDIYNIINKDDKIVTYEDICKAQDVLDLLSCYGGYLKLIKIKV